jgi:CHASE2 domain-containing sensor protein
MLPQLPFDLPSLAPSLGELPGALLSNSPWTWLLAGAALAVVSLWAVRRARRMVLAATVGVAGLLVAWNAGFLPLSA